jgi:seryl-tRNA synthetase
MLDLRFVEANPDLVRANLAKRAAEVDLDAILGLIARRRTLIAEVDALRAQIKTLAAQARGPVDESHRQRARELREREAGCDRELTAVEAELHERASWLPNMLDPRVPLGGEEANEVLRVVGDPPELDFKPKPHHEIGEQLGLIDVARGVRAAGARFYLLKNEAVRLRYALVRMLLDRCAAQGPSGPRNGFELVSPPYLARPQTLFASGYLPFAQKDNFRLADSDLSLIGTSEQSLLGIHLDEQLTELPLLYLGDSMCFRTETGNYGRDTAGIFRVHQFYKLEQIVYCRPAESEEWHLRCLENEEWLLQQLELPYRVVLTAAGDLAPPGAIKYDCEAWFPGQARYREVTSNTNLTDYQTRRGNVRYKLGSERGFPHTISATGFTDRHVLAIIENFQQPDGSVAIPTNLQPYMDGQTVITPRQ